MSTYVHFQEAVRAENPPDASHVGVCLTCKYWENEQRSMELTQRVTRCIQPQLAPLALIVSGSSACNKWAEKPGVPQDAKAYAEQKPA